MNKYYIPSHYYYGFIAYNDRQFDDALRSFKLVETFDAYKGVVPYYIAEIYYFQGKKDQALAYGESALGAGSALYYEKQLKLLTGQLYFEKQNFRKALPLLEDYVNQSERVTKEVLYELSYCNYKESGFEKAIEGFKQLSNERDSMGQNSMYLLGDLYLKTNQKSNARNAFQYCAYNNSNIKQQNISRFNYAKLSYELGYQDIALKEMKQFINDFPGSEYDTEAKEILVNLLANTNNFNDALELYESFDRPTASMKKVYPRILFGKAIGFINDQQPDSADLLLDRILSNNDAGEIIPYANFWKGELAYRKRDYDGAIRFLGIYLLANPPALGEANTVTAKYNTAYSFLQKENYRQALNYFEQVSGKSSATASMLEQDAYIRSADCYFMLKDFSKANTMYDNVVNGALQQSDYAMMQKGMIAGIKNSAEKIRILAGIPRFYPKSTLLHEINMEIALTYIADEKFREAVPFLNSIISSADGGGLKPKSYLKLGLSYYNSNDNKNALTTYQTLIQQYPQSPEAAEALGIIKDIYVEEGKPNEYVELMRKNGIVISVGEADSLTYISGLLKYNNNDCPAAINGLNNYISRFPEGAYLLDAYYLRSDCNYKNKDWQNALVGFEYVNSKGQNRYFEKATLAAARICYFELKDYARAKKYFESLRVNAVSQEIQLEALRGLVRTYYFLKDYRLANDASKELLTKKGISTDDRSIGFLVLGKSQQLANDCMAAIASFKAAASINKASWGAESRYEMAACHLSLNNLNAAEKAAMSVIRETGSYDLWVTKSYILLGDVFLKQKDYFNAKATYESVSKNAAIPELRTEAQQKLDTAIAEEKQHSRISN
jgi:TolA-binding protein